jgi:hypothetical protein
MAGLSNKQRKAGTLTALCRLTWNRAFSKSFDMVSGAYLRRQAETLIAMSRATIDLGMAGDCGKWRATFKLGRPSKRTTLTLG